MKKKTETEEQINCEICYLLKKNSPEIKFHLYDDGSFNFPGDKYVCQKCLDWIHLMRKLGSEQAKHPEKDAFENVSWWWQPKKENRSASEMSVK